MNQSRNDEAYRKGLMNNKRHPCVDGLVDIMHIMYQTDQNGGYRGGITRDNHYLLMLSEAYDYGKYTALAELIREFGDDYDRFSIEERCAICYKVISTMNALHPYCIFHGSLTPDNIYVQRNATVPGSPVVRIAGFGRVESSHSADDKTLVYTLINTLTNNGKIPLEILPSQIALREYFIGLHKGVQNSENRGTEFTIEEFDAWYKTGCNEVPVGYSYQSDCVIFLGNDSKPLADYSVTIVKGIKPIESIPVNRNTATYTRLSVKDELGVDIRLFIKRGYNGVTLLYAACLEQNNQELFIGDLIDDRPFRFGPDGEILADGTRITRVRKGLFGPKTIGQVVVRSPQIEN